jgi:hypothetical protein
VAGYVDDNSTGALLRRTQATFDDIVRFERE